MVSRLKKLVLYVTLYRYKKVYYKLSFSKFNEKLYLMKCLVSYYFYNWDKALEGL